ncbi:hypothetical protein BSNK01_20200 [Bacillaceae bacterium]
MPLLWAAAILAVSLIIALIEVPPLLKKRRGRELWVFSVLLLFGTGSAIAESLRVNIPNPIDWIIFVYKPISDFITAMLQE